MDLNEPKDGIYYMKLYDKDITEQNVYAWRLL